MVVVSKQSFLFQRRDSEASSFQPLVFTPEFQWLVVAQPDPQYAPDWVKETNLYKNAREKELLYEANVPKDVKPGKLNDTYTASPIPAHTQPDPEKMFPMNPEGTGLPGGKRSRTARENQSGGI